MHTGRWVLALVLLGGCAKQSGPATTPQVKVKVKVKREPFSSGMTPRIEYGPMSVTPPAPTSTVQPASHGEE